MRGRRRKTVRLPQGNRSERGIARGYEVRGLACAATRASSSVASSAARAELGAASMQTCGESNRWLGAMTERREDSPFSPCAPRRRNAPSPFLCLSHRGDGYLYGSVHSTSMLASPPCARGRAVNGSLGDMLLCRVVLCEANPARSQELGTITILGRHAAR